MNILRDIEYIDDIKIQLVRISYLADHSEDLIGGWVHGQDNYSPPENNPINPHGESGNDDEQEYKKW